MQLSKHMPDSVTIARILSVCGELKSLMLRKEVHGQVLKKNFECICFVSGEVVKLYGTCGAIDHAKSVFDAIPIKGSMTWTAIIEAYGYNNRCQDAIALFDQMRSGGFNPNHFTFKVVLSICDQAGLVDDACRIFNLMHHRYKASEELYTIIIGLLGHFVRVEEVQRSVQMSSLCTHICCIEPIFINSYF
ncbi:pentatricopeptide repeat-containing protein [Quercus suber]|uniref:Pentatricopeptide repeat-containing protein n=1 Tax=Quercus suber TaxID=58331 RepID=A0AAW0LHG1_QUESU